MPCSRKSQESWWWWKKSLWIKLHHERCCLESCSCGRVWKLGKPTWCWAVQKGPLGRRANFLARESASSWQLPFLLPSKHHCGYGQFFSRKAISYCADHGAWLSGRILQSPVWTIPLGALVQAAAHLKTISWYSFPWGWTSYQADGLSG